MSTRVFGVVAALLSCALAAGCGDGIPIPEDAYSKVESPSGDLIAYAYEFSDGESNVTQVMINFPGGCGSGAVAANDIDLGLALEWIDDQTLQVRHPANAALIRNASGDVIQCLDRKVLVELVSEPN